MSGDDTIGSYECRVTVKGYKEITASARVWQNGPPKILSTSSGTVSARRGSDAVLTCDSFAIPLPKHDIVWSRGGATIITGDKYRLDKAAKVDGIVSSLTVTNIADTDLGEYVCSINNDHGQDSRTVHLERIGRYIFECKISIVIQYL